MPKLRQVVLALVVSVSLPLSFSIAASASSSGSGGSSGSSGPIKPNWETPRAGRWFMTGRAITASPAQPRVLLPATPSCDGTFNAVTVPTGTQNSFLVATAAISSTDVWAVGYTNVSSTTSDIPITEHWNGTTWSSVAVPNPAGGSGFPADLFAVTAIASNDVWAFGSYATDSSFDSVAFSVHWDGTSWTMSGAQPGNPSFGQPTGFNLNFLLGATSLASNDVWAVGFYENGVNYQELAEHWNGSVWSVIPTPNPAVAINQFNSISAFSTSDIWAVGSRSNSYGTSTTPIPFTSLAEHWNGATWSVVGTPNEAGVNEIAGVVSLEGGHALGVGYGMSSTTTPAQSEAWDLLSAGGSTNSAQNGPGTGSNILESVDRSGAGVWAVGFSRATTTSPRQTMVRAATWNASTHTLTWGGLGAGDNPSTSNNVLFAVSAVSPYVFWAAGYAADNSGFAQPLTEGYCALHFTASAPPAGTMSGCGVPITVTVQNGSNATVAGYRGTVQFSSTDGAAILPRNYTFTSSDAGSHTFTVTFNTLGPQSVTVSDVAMPFTVPATSASGSVIKGVCQAPAGTPGARGGVLQGPPGTPGPRLIAVTPRTSARTSMEEESTTAATSATVAETTSQTPAVSVTSVGPAAVSASPAASWWQALIALLLGIRW